MEEPMMAKKVLMQEVVEEFKSPKKNGQDRGINNLHRIADPGATLALTIEAQH